MSILSAIFSCCSFNVFFYVPDKENPEITIEDPEEGFLEAANGKKIHYAFFKPEQKKPKATLFILHGNAGNLALWSYCAVPFVKEGYQVFLIDYQGFGKSEGRPTHKNVYEDAYKTLLYLHEREDVKNTKIIIYGFSIGGQLGISVASRYPYLADGIIVEGTFTSHNRIAVSVSPWFLKPIAKLMVRSPYKAYKRIKKLKIPILIVHGKGDLFIPYSMGQELYNNAPEPKYFFDVDGDHLDGIERNGPEYVKRVNEFVETLK